MKKKGRTITVSIVAKVKAPGRREAVVLVDNLLQMLPVEEAAPVFRRGKIVKLISPRFARLVSYKVGVKG